MSSEWKIPQAWVPDCRDWLVMRLLLPRVSAHLQALDERAQGFRYERMVNDSLKEWQEAQVALNRPEGGWGLEKGHQSEQAQVLKLKLVSTSPAEWLGSGCRAVPAGI